MITGEKAQTDILAYGLTTLLVIFMLNRYGRQAVKWLLLKFYELFLQNNPMKL